MKARKYFKQHRVSVIVGVVMALMLVVGLAIIIPRSLRGGIPATTQTPTPTSGVLSPTPTSGGATPTASPATTPTPTTSPGENTPTPEPGVVQGPQACPAGIGDPKHWDAIIGTDNVESFVQNVSCANILGDPSLQAMVLVRHTNGGATLDVYVFNHITSAKPTRIFQLQNLAQGDARISGYNTVMTAQADPNSRINAGKATAAWTKDLFREFQWNAAKGTLVQVALPGLFPDLTRYQAEADQAHVIVGQDTWKNDAKQVAKALAVQFFHWNRTLSATVVSGGGPSDVSATVRVQEAPGSDPLAPVPSVNVQLSRLEGNPHHLWVVTGVADSSLLTLTTVEPRSLVSSPVKLQGMGTTYGANEGIIGPAQVLDHLYTVIGQTTLIGAVGLGKTTYAANLSYAPSFSAGVQEGVVAVYEANAGTDDEIASAVLVKVLLDPQPNSDVRSGYTNGLDRR